MIRQHEEVELTTTHRLPQLGHRPGSIGMMGMHMQIPPVPAGTGLSNGAGQGWRRNGVGWRESGLGPHMQAIGARADPPKRSPERPPPSTGRAQWRPAGSPDWRPRRRCDTVGRCVPVYRGIPTGRTGPRLSTDRRDRLAAARPQRPGTMPLSAAEPRTHTPDRCGCWHAPPSPRPHRSRSAPSASPFNRLITFIAEVCWAVAQTPGVICSAKVTKGAPGRCVTRSGTYFAHVGDASYRLVDLRQERASTRQLGPVYGLLGAPVKPQGEDLCSSSPICIIGIVNTIVMEA